MRRHQAHHGHALLVAPCVGAWVEISVPTKKCCTRQSPPAWGRGLKFLNYNPPDMGAGRPLRGGVG